MFRKSILLTRSNTSNVLHVTLLIQTSEVSCCGGGEGQRKEFGKVVRELLIGGSYEIEKGTWFVKGSEGDEVLRCEMEER